MHIIAEKTTKKTIPPMAVDNAPGSVSINPNTIRGTKMMHNRIMLRIAENQALDFLGRNVLIIFSSLSKTSENKSLSFIISPFNLRYYYIYILTFL